MQNVQKSLNTILTISLIFSSYFSIQAEDVTSTYRKKAMEQINQFLNSVGAGATKFDENLGKAASAHHQYVDKNRDKIGTGLPPEQAMLEMHNEDPSLPGFIGKDPTEQAAHFGFQASEGHFVGNTFGANRCNDQIIANVILALANTFMHRSIVVNPGLEAVGFHIDSNGQNCIVTFFYSQHYFPKEKKAMYYPTAKTTPVMIQMQPEVPFVTGNNFESGFPISVQVFSIEEEALLVTEATLKDASGKKIPFYTIDSNSEGLTGQYAKSLKMAGIIPKEILKKNHTYSVSMQIKSNGKQVFSKSWKFQTGSQSLLDFYNQNQ